MTQKKRQNKIHAIKTNLKFYILTLFGVIFILNSVIYPTPSRNSNLTIPSLSNDFGNYIQIDGSYSLINYSKCPFVQGQGTLEDPYIIEGYRFTGIPAHPVVSIRNGFEYLIIQNCEIDADENNLGFEIVNVSNLVIKNCDISIGESDIALYIYNSSNVEINSCTISSIGIGLVLYNSDSIHVVNNSIKCQENAISTLNTKNINFHANHITSNNYGMKLIESETNQIIDNYIYDSHVGIILYKSDSNLFANNTIISNQYGMYCVANQNITINDNVFKKNREVSLGLQANTNFFIQENLFVSSKCGIYFATEENPSLFFGFDEITPNSYIDVTHNRFYEMYSRCINDRSMDLGNYFSANVCFISFWWTLGLPMLVISLSITSYIVIKKGKERIELEREIYALKQNESNSLRIKQLEEEIQKYKSLYEELANKEIKK